MSKQANPNGYSGTPLVKKLGIKEGNRVYTKNAPENYLELISPVPKDVKILGRICRDLDVIHFFTQSKKELEKSILKMTQSIKPAGMIWISWPKKSSKVATDITEDVIREVILQLGLVDVKVCAVAQTWSALKIVIRKENR